MDSLTHIALGACLGEIQAGSRLGKKTLVIGAVAQSLPDIDFMASFWLSPAEDLIAHRGFTHSIFFVLITAYALAMAASRWPPTAALRQHAWFRFFALQMAVHIVLDAFNAYGTAWFEPFSHYRVAFHSLFVADPFFSIPLGLAMITLVMARRDHPFRRNWVLAALFLSSAYVLYGLANKAFIASQFRSSLQGQGIAYTRSFTTPTPGNVWLWYAVAETEKGYFVGHRSVFDEGDSFRLQFFDRNEHYLDSIDDHISLQHLIRFSEGYYTVNYFEGRLVFNDLRFGQMLGWENPRAPFVFYYYLEHPRDNELLIQRGRFARWDMAALTRFFRRIRGIETLTRASPSAGP